MMQMGRRKKKRKSTKTPVIMKIIKQNLQMLFVIDLRPVLLTQRYEHKLEDGRSRRASAALVQLASNATKMREFSRRCLHKTLKKNRREPRSAARSLSERRTRSARTLSQASCETLS
eukprot:TRINITY_DN30179_c0_g1_i1.p1 TRINITY_DN30179_c0_g1~~TRINITY_DN30179_c0_g1_i1.p1  ORF type:complete len:117 (+),score=4.83 TRINITY_DN30179_c0_g1_i1:3-353(+)